MTFSDKQQRKVVGDAFCTVTVFGHGNLLVKSQQSGLEQTQTCQAASALICTQT